MTSSRRVVAFPRILLILIALLGLSLGWGCSHSPVEGAAETEGAHETRLPMAPDAAHPPYYRIEGSNGSTILLLGTIHLGPTGGWQLSKPIEAGLRQADRLILEIDLRDADEESVSTLVANLVMLAPPETLDDVLSPTTSALLTEHEDVLAASGFPENRRRGMKPWFIAVGLIETTAQKSGFSTSASVESSLLAAFADRPLSGLETLEEQMGLLNDLSFRLQDLMLRDTVSRLDEAVASLHELADAWRVSDLDALIDFSREGIDELPELADFYEILLTERNQRWMAKLRPLLEETRSTPETIFVGVGALHLVGSDGLLELFRKAGMTVSLVDQTGAREARRP